MNDSKVSEGMLGGNRQINSANLLSRLKKLFQDDEDIVIAYLFGSYASGKVGPLSDIDLALLLNHSASPSTYSDKVLHYVSKISKILDSDKLDLVILNRAPLGLQYEIVKKGRIIYCRDEEEKINYRIKIQNLYLDFKPFEDEYIQHLAQKIKEVGRC